MAKSNLASHKLFSSSLIMLLFALINVSASLASENYLPVENEGNSRQTRLLASSFKLLWYMWILWLLKVRRTFLLVRNAFSHILASLAYGTEYSQPLRVLLYQEEALQGEIS